METKYGNSYTTCEERVPGQEPALFWHNIHLHRESIFLVLLGFVSHFCLRKEINYVSVLRVVF